MKSASLHLNLLKETEHLSSSPVRLRVMLPIIALFICLGVALWWAILFTQLIMARTEAQGIDTDLKAKSEAHAEAIGRQDLVRETRQQLDQLSFYRKGVRHIAEPLAKLAEVMPLKVQLTELSFAPPPPEAPPKPGVKVPAFGPTTNVETQKLVIAGRTTGNTPIEALLISLDDPSFEPLVTKEKRIKSFDQDSAAGRGKRRLLAFDVEYVMPGRMFTK